MSLPNVGILFHHRYHTTEKSLILIEDYLVWLKQLENVQFLNQEEIYNTFVKK